MTVGAWRKDECTGGQWAGIGEVWRGVALAYGQGGCRPEGLITAMDVLQKENVVRLAGM